jgi:diaminobutyrate-2-oxoglutarate transaminase
MSGAGALNYGHNHPRLKAALLEYIEQDGVVHSLDLHTSAKGRFLESLDDIVLAPRGLRYRVQFTGPTGTNAMEAALKVARHVTGRTSVVAFTNGFHGLSLGALALSGTDFKRAAAGVPLQNVDRMPYDGYLGAHVDTAAYLERLIEDPGSGVDVPAAIVLETVQGEGGLGAARPAWLRKVAEIAHRHGILLVVDDIQAGCGRTGTFFSFESAQIVPDIVCLSKSISGYGLPLALTLVRPDFDVLSPGAHSGTFRGHNLAFVTAAAALDLWAEPDFARDVSALAEELGLRLSAIADRFTHLGCAVRGRGLMRGLGFADPTVAAQVSARAFRRGVLAETSGAAGHVLKIMPPIVMDRHALGSALDPLEAAIADVTERE